MQNGPFSPGLKVHPNLKVMTTKGMDVSANSSTTNPAPQHLNSEVLTALSPQVPTLGALPQHIEPHTLIVRYVLSAGGLFQAVLLIYLRQQISQTQREALVKQNNTKYPRRRAAPQLEAVTTHKRRTREARRRGHFL